MIKTGLLAAVAGISGFLTSTQMAAANGLADQVGATAASVIAVGWLGVLAALALAIVWPLLKH